MLAFHEECDRYYTSKAGTVTPCKTLSSKNGRSNVMFANGGASVCSAQLSWRQSPAAVKRSEQQARDHQTRKQAVAEGTNRVQRHKESQGTAAPSQPPTAQVTEAEINAVLQDPGYKQAGLTKGAARQIAKMKQDKGKVQREQYQGKERYQAALLSKGRQEMEGWGHNVVDKDKGSDMPRLIGTAWETVLAPAVAGKQLSAKKAAGRV